MPPTLPVVKTPKQQELDDALRKLGHQSFPKFVLDHVENDRSLRWISRELLRLIPDQPVSDVSLGYWVKEWRQQQQLDT